MRRVAGLVFGVILVILGISLTLVASYECMTMPVPLGQPSTTSCRFSFTLSPLEVVSQTVGVVIAIIGAFISIRSIRAKEKTAKQFPHARETHAISLAVSALIVVALVAVVGIELYINSTYNAVSSVSKSSTISSCCGALQPETTSRCSPICSTTSSTHSDTSTMMTCTDIPAISYMICPSPLRISAVGTPGAGPGVCPSPCNSWNFTVTISSNSVSRGQSILLTSNLTNLGGDVTLSPFAIPYINPSVSTLNGTQVWAWDPSAIMEVNRTITAGETMTQQVEISTAPLLSGHSYLIQVAPISLQFPTPNNYTFSFQISIS